MSDLKFYQQQARGSLVWGDLELTPTGDLATVDRPQDKDTQDAVIRLLTDPDSGRGFEHFPQVGAGLSRFIGETSGLDQLQAIDRACEQAMRQDRRFPMGVQCRSVQLEPGSVRIYVMRPNAGGGHDLLSPPVEFDGDRGIAPLDEKRPSPWLWRRGLVAIQQSARLWRAWMGPSVLWRLTPEGLLTRSIRAEPLEHLGMFHEPFLAWDGGLLLCGKGQAASLMAPKAWTKPEGWITPYPVVQVDSLPRYDLPDGIWCDEETGWNIVITIAGQTAGQFSEGQQQWEFRSVLLTDSL